MKALMPAYAFVWGLCWLLLSFIPLPLHAGPATDFRVLVFEDPSKKMAPDDVVQAFQAGQFQHLPGQHFSAGYSQSVFWLWWQPKTAPPAGAGQFYLNLDYPLLQSALF